MYDETLLLKRLIDDLRTLSLADAGELKLVYQPVQPRELLEQVRQSFEPLAQEQQVALQVEADENLPDAADRPRADGAGAWRIWSATRCATRPPAASSRCWRVSRSRRVAA